MLILPYSTELTYTKRPLVTYGMVLLCFVVFVLQRDPAITKILMYYPNTLNPLTMLTSSFAHGGWLHIIGNLIFYIAFAPSLEVIINNKLKYIWIMMFIAFVVGLSYSISVFISHGAAIPSLGFSGIVSGMIGLSAYLIPKVRIKVFWWYLYGGKVFHVEARLLAVWFIGLDTVTMLTASSYGYINVVAHVAGGFAGYFYGVLWLKDIKEETREELAAEMKAMAIERTKGKMQSQNYRDNLTFTQQKNKRNKLRDFDKFMHRLHSLVCIKEDRDAILLFSTKFDLDSSTQELEDVFKRIQTWGISTTLLCVGRLIIDKHHQTKSYGRAIVYIEKCQTMSNGFILPDSTQTQFYVDTALAMNKPLIAQYLSAS